MTQNEKDILEVIRELPGLTSRQIGEFCPHIKAHTVRIIVRSLAAQGHIHVQKKLFDEIGRKGRKNLKVYEIATVAPPKLRVVDNDNTEIEKLLAWKAFAVSRHPELASQLDELRTWRNAVLARFPDLAVEPVVIEARKIAAQILADQGDSRGAKEVLDGQRDSTALIRSTAQALRMAA